ncbi:hypothetical protein H2200_009100 [Cladophialophora chaetospira]|uniref:Major facilitator superfamily (MFS) profile domain-containing protein n=1 Tax=Cladophialophora chaetospira TaxID=386627 RepID=A0AA38X3G5_9EURO|nr:hypothetical protein H2200_009100 [Cladophialophora chaetospira]
MAPSTVSKEADTSHVEFGDHAQPDANEVGVVKTLVTNPKIIGLALFANLGAIMYGYDNLALSLCLSMFPFQMQFGEQQQTATGVSYIIPAYWQSLWGSLAQVATAIGALVIAAVSDRFGRKISFVLAGVFSAAGIAILYTASHPGTFLAGKMVNGISLGMAMSTGQTYVSEIAPVKIRGILLSAYAFCLNLGLLMAASISFARITIVDDSAYKLLFAVGWLWAGLLLTLSWVIPESPIHHVRKGDVETAKKCFKQIYGGSANISAILTEAVRTDREEKLLANSAKDATYLECFRRNNWRRTRIVLYCNGLSQMVGATFVANSPYFLVSAGMTPAHVALVIQVGMALGCGSMILTFFLLGKFSRRSIVLVATGICAAVFLPMGIAGCFSHNTGALWAVGCLLQVAQFVGLGPAVGPAMAIAGEVSELRLRSKTQSVGFFFNYIFSTIWNVVVPYMFNADQGNLGGKMGFIYFATSIIAVVVLFFEMPETKDMSYEQLDQLFERKVPARKFQSVVEASRIANAAQPDLKLESEV